MKVKITGLVKYGGKWRVKGDILTDVSEEIGKQMIAQDVAEEVLKTPAEIASEEEAAAAETAKKEAEKKEAEKKEAEKKLKSLRKKAAELGIEGAADKDAETLLTEIAAKEQK
ncbi:DUF7210 family protein [Paenibacillus koleovorans]|uniref:DUF7210 family protein n=1 Tax=Paenibacillus koleovorans TaxID=121608 RepID=UPI000FD9AAA8|nr:hypothetical protein [Paenibacillus koleovorans]